MLPVRAGAAFRKPALDQVPQGEKVHPRGGSRSRNDAEGPSAQGRASRAAEGKGGILLLQLTHSLECTVPAQAGNGKSAQQSV